MDQSAAEEQRRELVAAFRHGVVAELANPYMSDGEPKATIAEKARRSYEIPFSKKTTITEGCIKKWLALYRRYGKAGLLPKVRADKGFSRVLEEAERDAFIEYLSEHPELTARAVYRKLYEKGTIKTVVTTARLLTHFAGLKLTHPGALPRFPLRLRSKHSRAQSGRQTTRSSPASPPAILS